MSNDLKKTRKIWENDDGLEEIAQLDVGDVFFVITKNIKGIKSGNWFFHEYIKYSGYKNSWGMDSRYSLNSKKDYLSVINQLQKKYQKQFKIS